MVDLKFNEFFTKLIIWTAVKCGTRMAGASESTEFTVMRTPSKSKVQFDGGWLLKSLQKLKPILQKKPSTHSSRWNRCVAENTIFFLQEKSALTL